MKTCRNCEKEIVKIEGQRMRRFYCSHTCYERYNSRMKYHKNPEKSKQRAKLMNSKAETKERYASTIKSHKKWCKSQGLTVTQYHEYGYTFLKNNPDVVEVLRILNEINSNKTTKEEIREYKRLYYQKNKEIFKERARQRRLAKKNNEV